MSFAPPQIGLSRHEVTLHQYHADWPRIFTEERVQLAATLQPLSFQIEHIGSTAISGLIAKPIIDIALGASSTGDIERFADRLAQYGYVDRGKVGRDGGVRLIAEENQHSVRSFHIHILRVVDRNWRLYQHFKYTLMHNTELFNEYLRLKQILQARYPYDRKAYTEGKAYFFDKVHSLCE